METTSNKPLVKEQLLYGLEDKPNLSVSLLLAFQHILAAFSGIIAVPCRNSFEF